MNRRDWLLLLLAYQGAPDGLDPVRIHKGLFLLREDPAAAPAPAEAYEFIPYNFGPMSKQVYADLDALVAEGLASAKRVEGQSWALFRATPRGLRRAEQVVEQMGSSDIPVARRLFDIKQLVAEKTFAELVEYVYDRFPAYEARSVFRRAPTH